MKNVHLVYIPMTGVGLSNGYRGDEWFKYRIGIFKRYTLQSLAHQTNKNFVIWMSFRPEEANNPLVNDIEEAIKETGLRYVFTFDGLMYWDDKFSKGFISKSKNIARVLRDKWRGRQINIKDAIKEILRDKNSTLKERLGGSLEQLKQILGICDWVYMTRLDSDDMLHHEFIDEVQNMVPEFRRAICVKNGYVYDSASGNIAEWTPKTNPPFHTIMFPGAVFFSPEDYLLYYEDFKSHEDIARIFNRVFLPDGMYCVVTHSPTNQISTIWDHPFRGSIVERSKVDEFM